MADLIAYQDGNFTGATTFRGIFTAAKQATNTSSSSSTTAYVWSANWSMVSGDPTIDGVLLYLQRTSTTGTFSVAFSDAANRAVVTELAVNCSDLPASPSWVFFKFPSSYSAPSNKNSCSIGIKSSTASTVTVYRDATAGNWAKYVRITTAATAAAADVTFICDELTGAGTKNDITVTMDSTSSATSYGEMNIGQGGVLSYGTSASTNYILDLSGNLNVWSGGTLNIGTSGTPIPSTSSAVLEFTNASNVDRGLEARSGSTVGIYGATKSNTKTLLTADAAAGQAVINVTSTTDWAANDVVALASTTRTASQSEKGTVSTVNSGTQATLTANLTNVHHGTSPYIGEVVNLTRNVKIRGTSQTLCAYVNCADTSSFTASYAEFYWLGSTTANKEGIRSSTTLAGTFSVTFCSMYDYCSAVSSNTISVQGASASWTVDDCAIYASTGTTVLNSAATSGTPSYQRNYIIGNNSQSVTFLDLGGTIKDNRFGGCDVTFREAGATIGTIKDNVEHSATSGFTLGTSGSIMSGTFDGLTAWRNSTTGIIASGGGYTITNATLYHNATANLDSPSTTGAVGVTVTSSTFNGGTGASLSATGYHIRSTATPRQMVFDSCSFSATNATQSGLFLGSSGLGVQDVLFRKCTIADSTIVDTQSGLLATQEFTSAIKFDKFNNTSGSHRIYKRYGRTEADQATYKTAAPSEALLPNNASNKLTSGSKKFAVASGTTATVTVYVNKSGTYNGNQPRLIVKANSIAGISTDTVLATASGGTGSWLTLSGTTATVSDDCVLEVYVDCDGTAGTVYVDDWSVS